MKYVRPYTVILATALICSAGCTPIGSTVDTDDGYYTEIRMSELEYRTFLAKQTSSILSMLVSHAAVLVRSGSGLYLLYSFAGYKVSDILLTEESAALLQIVL